MKLHIKYMISARCKMAVKDILKGLGLHFIVVDLGEVDIMEDISSEKREQLRIALLAIGLELMEDKKAILIEKIKNIIIEKISQTDELNKINFSDFLSEKLKIDYTVLANLFSEVQGTTIGQFIITHKIERIKELIVYNEMNFTDIAWKMNYSSVGHFSNQFKKSTGMTPTQYKELVNKRHDTVKELANQAC